MSIAEKLTAIAENVPKVYEAGQKSEQDRFWDSYQNKGGAVNGTYMFSGYAWNDEIFNPKYPIILSKGGTGLFSFTKLTDIKVMVDATATSDVTHLFNWGQSIKIIPLFRVSVNNIYTNWFNYCISLEEIQFEGTIGKSLDIHWSTKLSAESYENIFKCMTVTVSGQTLTVPKSTAEATYNAKYGSGKWASRVNGIKALGWAVSYL